MKNAFLYIEILLSNLKLDAIAYKMSYSDQKCGKIWKLYGDLKLDDQTKLRNFENNDVIMTSSLKKFHT